MLTLEVGESAAEVEGVSSPDALPPNAEDVLEVGFGLFGDDGYGCGGSWYSGGGLGLVIFRHRLVRRGSLFV